MNSDCDYMYKAIVLARIGIGYVNPNPAVGAVIVKNNRVIGKGYHRAFGLPHAEIDALHNAIEDVTGATMYVTLEPCTTHGKTPPCVYALINAGIARCVIGVCDPNPDVNTQGIAILQQHGIEVTVGVCEEACKAVNAPYFTVRTTGLPYLFVKYASTLDGKLATCTGDSKWISNDTALTYAHQLRHRFMAIMVGIGTVIRDNPSLNVRRVQGKNPYRIVVDPKLHISEQVKLIQQNEDRLTILVTSADNKNTVYQKYLATRYGITFVFLTGYDFSIEWIKRALSMRGIDSILLEGGVHILSRAFCEEAVDAGNIMIAPILIGDKEAKSIALLPKILHITHAYKLPHVQYTIFDDNIRVVFSKYVWGTEKVQ